MGTESIKAIKVFESLSEGDLARIDEYISWKNFPKDLNILTHHEYTSEVYFIVSGTVRATTYSLSGKEIAYQDLSKGEMFGEISAIDHQNRTTNVLVLENSKIGVMSSKSFWQIIEQYPAVVRLILLRLTSLVRFLCGRVYAYGAMGVNDRIRAEILHNAKDWMTSSNSAMIKNMPTHEEIANRVSTHREAVTKEFSYLYKGGFIEKAGTNIIVPDIEKLQGLIAESL